jgi:hypothetical protein
MAQFSTGLGLAVLGGCILGAAAISSHRLGGEAFAQGTGGERRIVYTNLMNVNNVVCAYRIWSDNSIDWRGIGAFRQEERSCIDINGQNSNIRLFTWTRPLEQSPWCPNEDTGTGWRTIDNGTSGFRPITDVDMSGETDAGDISQVLMDFNTSSDDLPPPPIDCTINAPR